MVEGMDDDIAVLVMAVASVTWPRAHSTIAPFAVDWTALHQLLPRLRVDVTSTALGYAPWDHDEVQTWFAQREVATEPLTVLKPRRWSTGYRTKRHNGWWFANGSTFIMSENWPDSVGILEDGRRVFGFHRAARLTASTADEGFNAYALRTMAARAELPSLPMCPTPRELYLP